MKRMFLFCMVLLLNCSLPGCSWINMFRSSEKEEEMLSVILAESGAEWDKKMVETYGPDWNKPPFPKEPLKKE